MKDFYNNSCPISDSKHPQIPTITNKDTTYKVPVKRNPCNGLLYVPTVDTNPFPHFSAAQIAALNSGISSGKLQVIDGFVTVTEQALSSLAGEITTVNNNIDTINTNLQNKQDKLPSHSANKVLSTNSNNEIVWAELQQGDNYSAGTGITIENETISVDFDEVASTGQIETISGQIDGISTDITNLQSAVNSNTTSIATKQDALDSSQLSATNSGITTAKVSSYENHISNNTIHVTSTDKSNWNAKENSSNKTTSIGDDSNTLFPTVTAVKNFVNSSVSTNTAYFLGTLDVVDHLGLTLEADEGEVSAALNEFEFMDDPTLNDYVFVVYDDGDDTKYVRYKYGIGTVSSTENPSWIYEYILNNSSFTANQWAAINSGITAEILESASTGLNQAITGVSNLESTKQDVLDPGSGILIEDDEISVDTDVIATKQYVTSSLSSKQNTLSTTQLNAVNSGITSSKVSDITSNTSARHSHSNKTVLDGIASTNLVSSSDRTTWNGKQATLVSGTNIKTINGQTILGSGNIEIQGGGGSFETLTTDEIDEIWGIISGYTVILDHSNTAISSSWGYSLDNGESWQTVSNGLTTLENITQIKFKLSSSMNNVYIQNNATNDKIISTSNITETISDNIVLTEDTTFKVIEAGPSIPKPGDGDLEII